MSSNQPIIRQIASKILTTIKTQFPNNYNDNQKKEQLVKNILGKIDRYSKQINPNTAPKIAQVIINDIISETNQANSNMSNLQFERNSMMNNKPIIMQQRPQQIQNNKQQSTGSINNVYEQMMQSRQQEMAESRQRPTTPDFSLDGSGKKKENKTNQQFQQQAKSS